MRNRELQKPERMMNSRLASFLLRTLVLALLVLCASLAFAVGGVTVAAQATAAPPTTSAARADANLPSAEEILAKYREAIGGEAAIRRHTSRRITGKFELPANGMGGPIEVLAAAPNKTRMRIELAGLGIVERGFDGEIGWAIDPAIGPRVLQGRELDEIAHSADYYYDLRSPDSGLTMTVVERAPFEGRDCYAVRVVRPSGFEVLEYYDAQTGLAAGYQMSSTSPMGTVPSVVTVVGDYRKFGPLLIPTSMQQRAMGMDTTLRIEAVEYDTVPADSFTPPAEIKALGER
jgi:hypothetical protein